MDEKEILVWAEASGISVEQAKEYLKKLEPLDKIEANTLRKVFSGVSGPVLELSAGRGEFTRQLLEKYIHPDGKLYTTERLSEVAEKLIKEIPDKRLEVLVSDSSKLPLPNGSVGLVISRAALHDFVSDDGDVVRALNDCVRVLAPGGIFVIYDKIKDGYKDVETESAEGRMERMNVELASLESKLCWGLHYLKDYVRLMEEMGFKDIQTTILEMPDQPGYIKYMTGNLNQRRPAYVKRWGEKVNVLLDSLYADFQKTHPRALSMALIWGQKK
ncbi:MAG: class I SAM-dependent methyltransferase [Candidatus Edwardsbacteria bacterium]|nr:class I SAM-dependent methyltransferase [Candidatus Edwardsbacteria bacterium]MBU1575886.1 class I SAM-dependent methyltransferase [Candidatus Edwardsbacteria bacterium]MBU2464342.1 class I SAM-dependent methyltransferase [Candidatus Edwardsbacteria bacterium]MBU2593099.1 class I SAM-dependent methyltransferase [Candidatus Edwardsbacteria bacterium]